MCFLLYNTGVFYPNKNSPDDTCHFILFFPSCTHFHFFPYRTSITAKRKDIPQIDESRDSFFFKVIINPDWSEWGLFHRSLKQKRKLSNANLQNTLLHFRSKTCVEFSSSSRTQRSFWSQHCLYSRHSIWTVARLHFHLPWPPRGTCFSDEIHQFFIIPEKTIADWLSLVDLVILPWGVKNRWGL